MGNYVIALVGPTAIGKTKFAITLAKHFKTEILSADSRQFYKEMTIGTAVPSPTELQAVRHHCIQHLSIFDPYSVGTFENQALELLATLFLKKNVVVLVGGSGLYMNAVLYGLDDFPEVPLELRDELNTLFERQGIETLQQKLAELDPVYYEKVDRNNPHRLIRALEVCIASGQPYSAFLKNQTIQRPFKTILLGIHAEREIIYDRINRRVEEMMDNGLLEEAKALYPNRELNALQTVGYKELFAHFDGKMTLDQATEEIKKNTRRFAKRQLTWYRKNKDIVWLEYDLPEKVILEKLEHLLKVVTNGKE